MIVQDTRGELVRHYSDAGVKIKQIETGALYTEAVDVAPCRYTYEETDVPIQSHNMPYISPSEAVDAVKILLGLEEDKN